MSGGCCALHVDLSLFQACKGRVERKQVERKMEVWEQRCMIIRNITVLAGLTDPSSLLDSVLFMIQVGFTEEK